MSLAEFELPVTGAEQIFPIDSEVAVDVLRGFMTFDNSLFSTQLNKEVKYMVDTNNEALQFLFRSSGANGADPRLHGGLVLHRMLREQAGLSNTRLPRFNPGFTEELRADRMRRVRLYSEACCVPLREVILKKRDRRIELFGETEREFLEVLATSCEDDFDYDYYHSFVAGSVTAYYVIKDGIAVPRWYT